MIKYSVAALLGMAALQSPGSASATDSLNISGPDLRNRIDLSIQEGKLIYKVSRDDHAVLAPSPIGLFTSQGPIGVTEVKLLGTQTRQRQRHLSPYNRQGDAGARSTNN